MVKRMDISMNFM